MLPFALFKNKQGRKCGKCSFGCKLNKKVGKIGQSSIACHQNSRDFKAVVCVWEVFFFFCWSQLSSSRLLLTQTNRRQAAQLVTGQGRVGASKLLRSTNTQSWCEEMGKIHGPSLQALLSLLSSPPRYQMQCLFLQRWSRRPIWMCRSGPHLLCLSFTAWYLPSVKPAGGGGV